MARPKALDPSQVRQLAVLFRKGKTLAEVRAWCGKKGWQIAASSLASYRREALGPAAEDPTNKVRRAVRGGAGGCPAARAKAAAPPPQDEEGEEAADLDHRAALQQQLRQARALSRRADNLRDQLAAAKLAAELLGMIRELDKAAGEQGPRVVFYFPERVTIERLESGEE